MRKGSGPGTHAAGGMGQDGGQLWGRYEVPLRVSWQRPVEQELMIISEEPLTPKTAGPPPHCCETALPESAHVQGQVSCRGQS